MVKLRRSKKYSNRRPKIYNIHERNQKKKKETQHKFHENKHTNFRFICPKTIEIINLDQNEQSYFVRIALSLFITSIDICILFSEVLCHSINHQPSAHNQAVRNYYRLFCLMALGQSFSLSGTPLANTVIINNNERRQEKSLRNMFNVQCLGALLKGCQQNIN